MHCHVLDHMANDGMMGSLLIVDKDDPKNLAEGTIDMKDMGMPDPATVVVAVADGMGGATVKVKVASDMGGMGGMGGP